MRRAFQLVSLLSLMAGVILAINAYITAPEWARDIGAAGGFLVLSGLLRKAAD